jgi:hypothetical protein
MQTILKEKLWAFIIQNNPDLMFNLQADYSVSKYLDDKVSQAMPMVLQLLSEGKPGHAIEELVIEKMTAELKPSRFLYLQEVLRAEFTSEFQQYREAGVLTYETVNLIDYCADVFEAFAFNQKNQSDSKLRHAIIAKVHQYLP